MTSISDTEVVNAPGGLVELGRTTGGYVTTNTTSETTGMDMGCSLSIVCDGSPLLVEAWSNYAAAGSGGVLFANVYVDGVTVTNTSRIWRTSRTTNDSIFGQMVIQPNAGIRTIAVRPWHATTAGYVDWAVIRVSKIIQASQLLVTQSNAPIVTSLPSGNLVTGQEVYLYSSSPAGYQRQFWDGTQWNITGDSRASTGIFRCTSTTRPSSPLEGQQIYETDTKKIMTYDGVDWYAFNQLIGDSGLIGTTYNTVATHTTVQTITGMNPSVKYGKNRKLKLTASLQLYTPGGVQAVLIAFYRGSTEVARFYYDPNVMNAGGSTGFTPSNIITTPGTGATETFTCRIAAASNNTVVTAYANSGANQYQQFWIEDVGPA